MIHPPPASVVTESKIQEPRALPELLALIQQQTAQMAFFQQMLFAGPNQRIFDEERRPLTDHLADFEKWLSNEGNTKKHVIQVMRQTRAVVSAASAVTWSQLTPSSVKGAIASIKASKPQGKFPSLSIETANHYLSSIKAFCNWMVCDYRANRSPCLPLRPDNAATDPRHPRRALSQTELLALVDATNRGIAIAGIPAYERAMSYLQAATTGIRSGELQSLTRGSFRLDVAEPYVKILAAYAKNGETQTVPIRADVAEMLRSYFEDIARDTLIIRRPKSNAMRGLRHDLKSAGIVYETDDGFADFHALRHTFITDLFDKGGTPAAVQKLARHKTSSMTARYAHSTGDGRRRLVECLNPLPAIARRIDTPQQMTRMEAGHINETGRST